MWFDIRLNSFLFKVNMFHLIELTTIAASWQMYFITSRATEGGRVGVACFLKPTEVTVWEMYEEVKVCFPGNKQVGEMNELLHFREIIQMNNNLDFGTLLQ